MTLNGLICAVSAVMPSLTHHGRPF